MRNKLSKIEEQDRYVSVTKTTKMPRTDKTRKGFERMTDDAQKLKTALTEHSAV